MTQILPPPAPVVPAPVGSAPAGPVPGQPPPSRRARTAVGLLAAGTAGGLLVGAVAGAAAGLTAARVADEPAAFEAAAPAAEPVDVPVASSGSVDWAAVAERASASTVSIRVSDGSQGGEGTGVVLDEAGHVLTNNHVVAPAGDRGEILLTLADGRVVEAEVAGLDPATDLAVVRIVDPPSDLVPATFGDSGAVGVGDPVMAIGNPLGLQGTVTTGIVSAVDRPVTAGDGQGPTVVTAAIQTDAAVNPGNSGGPLVDAAGRVVGINSAIATLGGGLGGQSGSIGLGFAIPIDEAREVAAELVEDGSADHAQLGVTARDTVVDTGDGRRAAAGVVEVVPGSPAEEAGLESGDAIVAVDGRATPDALSLTAVVRSYRPGETVTLIVARDGATIEVDASLAVADARSS
ncbi:MAG: S1C family serine protease [Kineosporiaceae bacterium]